MGGESHGNGNANATSRGVHPRATAAVVANGRSGKGNAGKGGGEGSFADKRKFMVPVRRRQWSSVRYVNETLKEFATAILRDARRLAFGNNDDSIQRLQLDYSENFESEDLHDYVTLGDVIIFCKSEDKCVIIEASTQLTPPPRMPRTGILKQRPDSKCTPQSTNAIDRNCNDSVAAPRSSPDLLARSAAPKFPFPDYEPPCSGAPTTNPRASKNYIPSESPSLQFHTVERAWSFHPDYVAGAGANLPPLPRSRGKLNMGGAGQEKYLRSPNHPAGGANNAKRSLRGATSHGNSKKKSSSSSNSSANVRNSLASQSGDGEGLDNELPNGGSERVFAVHRRSKRSKTRLQGVGTHDLKMSNISAHFHLTLRSAAKEMGVAQTTLKKACRYFGLGRWPGRKVRSLQRAIQGLLHESVVGQGAGLEEMTMGSDILKLQQELDQLVHGTRAQVTQKMIAPQIIILESDESSSSLVGGEWQPHWQSKTTSGEKEQEASFVEGTTIVELRSPKRKKIKGVSDCCGS